MTGTPTRVQPLSPPYEPAVEERLRRWMPPNAPFEPLLLFRTLRRNGGLADALLPLGAYQLSGRSSLGIRQRELVILRTCARLGADYEWGVHATAFADRAGLGPGDLGATALPGVAEVWSEEDGLLLTMVDELVDRAQVSDRTWTGLASTFDEDQLLELLVLCGFYHVISFLCRGLDLTVEPWAVPFPAGVPRSTVQ